MRLPSLALHDGPSSVSATRCHLLPRGEKGNYGDNSPINPRAPLGIALAFQTLAVEAGEVAVVRATPRYRDMSARASFIAALGIWNTP